MESKAIPISWKKQRNPLKRIFDIGFSIAILLLFSPLFLLIAVAIFICSPGKVLYTQMRLGIGGKPFKCYKFRTMRLDADLHLKEMLRTKPLLRSEWIQKQKLRVDPRVFLFGRLLRKTSLDELPQFWNAFKGDISVVGPRPYMVNQRRELGPLAYKILSVRPGITGLWQTSGRSNTTFQERVELDAHYVDGHCFRNDLWLILKTVPEIFLSKNAY